MIVYEDKATYMILKKGLEMKGFEVHLFYQLKQALLAAPENCG